MLLPQTSNANVAETTYNRSQIVKVVERELGKHELESTENVVQTLLNKVEAAIQFNQKAFDNEKAVQELINKIIFDYSQGAGSKSTASDYQSLEDSSNHNQIFVIKRNGSLDLFDLRKIENAVFKAMEAENMGKRKDAKSISNEVLVKIQIKAAQAAAKQNTYTPTVEEIQDLVENELMSSNFHSVAKAYILYRAERAKLRENNLFKRRINLKPFEYPELYEYVNAIRHSYWIHTEFNYVSDIQDFKVNVNDVERSAIKNSMIAIAQVEVAVKSFWGDLFKRIPKPELASVGYTFAESEVRHADAYSHLLDILGLNQEFENIQNIPALMQRVNYLDLAIKSSRSEDNREYIKSVALFSLFIEHVSLFSQFLIMMSFNKYKNLFKGISNAVEATSKEEQIHGLFGIDLIKIIRKENPEWFDEDFQNSIVDSCKEAYKSEKKVLDWILEKGDLDFLPKVTILEFIKNRFNNSLVNIGLEKVFKVDESIVEQTDWFDAEVIATKHGDFFVKRSINYNKRNQSVTADDLF